MIYPAILSSARLLEILNEHQPESERISKSTLYRWLMRNPRWRACIVQTAGRKVWMSSQKLVDVGVLPRPDQPRILPIGGLTFSYETKAVVQ